MAGFSIDTFTAKLKQGGALASLFEAELTTTKGTEDEAAVADFKFLCKATTLPGDTIDVATVTYMGRGINIPSNRAAVQWTTTVYNDEGMGIRNNIESWMEKLNSHKSNVRDSGMSQIQSYTGTLKVKTFEKAGTVIPKSYEFIDAWPSAVGEITVDWETNDIQTYDVTWEFSYWRSNQSNVGFS
ncbi:MAG: hypothetical protein MK229_05555 [Nitrososphaerales archaeon]|nr:hypothetical protein [Nitrososphaerales archaeon]